MVRALLLSLGLLLAAAAPAHAAPATLTLKGPSGALVLAAEDVAAAPHVALSVLMEGKRYRFEGVPLHILLAKVGAPYGAALRGPHMTDVVLATARDGYQIVLALAESDPGMRKTRVIVADRADGKPLAAADGPYRLVVEGDLRPARSARMITMIEVRQLAPARGPGR